ncbi:MAG: DoxX family protein [Chlamydiales bacterium]|nr:DoxX family protein [Chlamydiia bacterium]MCB1083040.1 DoxX family protein [Simkania sp.]MCP5503836.1 DoxX family protein [Chlamydiales bacterium]
MNRTILFIARGCFSLIFIVAGVGKLMNWQGTVDQLVLTFSEWYMHFEGSLITRDMHELLVSSGYTILSVATCLEIVGALFILTGFKVRIGALLLLIFMIPVTLIMHPFWFSIGSEMQRELSIFLKNLSLIGALLYFLVGPQPQRASK